MTLKPAPIVFCAAPYSAQNDYKNCSTEHRACPPRFWCGNGCPPSDRLALCKAYIAKAVWDFATTCDLIDAEQMLKMLG